MLIRDLDKVVITILKHTIGTLTSLCMFHPDNVVLTMVEAGMIRI